MIPVGPDLLIVGGLAIDRLADGTTRAGGTVLHAARAVTAAGWRVATITAAGPEPEATAALAELAGLGASRTAGWPATIRFALHDDGRGRRLVLEAAGGDLTIAPAEVASIAPRCVLLGPIAGGVSARTVRACATVPVRVAALQGWLRHLVPGEEALPLALGALGSEAAVALGDLDALVASDEDLAAVAPNPPGQLEALRAYFGARLLLLVTAGADGAWLDDPATGIRHMPAPHRVPATSTVGAGDAFAGLLAIGLGAGLTPIDATTEAMDGAAAYLAARR